MMHSEEKIEKFWEEINAIEKKYGLYINADYTEHFDYDYEGEMYSTGGEAEIILVDSDGKQVDW